MAVGGDIDKERERASQKERERERERRESKGSLRRSRSKVRGAGDKDGEAVVGGDDDSRGGRADKGESAPGGPSGGGGWGVGSLDAEGLRAATAPPKDEREQGGGNRSWLTEAGSFEGNRAELKSASGMGIQELNASLRRARRPKSVCCRARVRLVVWCA